MEPSRSLNDYFGNYEICSLKSQITIWAVFPIHFYSTGREEVFFAGDFLCLYAGGLYIKSQYFYALTPFH